MDVISYWFGKVPQNAYEAAGLGDYRMTKKLEPNLKDQEYKELILFAAIHGGSVKVFEFLYMKGYPLKFKKENHVCLQAVEQLVISNNIKLLKYLIDQCIVGLNSSMVRYLTDFAWKYGNVDIFEFFIEHYSRFALDICQSTNDLHSTIVYGNLELTEVWLANHNELIRMDDKTYGLLLQSCVTTALLSHQQDMIEAIRKLFQDQYQRRHLFEAIVSNTV